LAGEHAVDLLSGVDDPLLSVGTNGDVSASTLELMPSTITILIQLLGLVGADSVVTGQGIDLRIDDSQQKEQKKKPFGDGLGRRLQASFPKTFHSI